MMDRGSRRLLPIAASAVGAAATAGILNALGVFRALELSVLDFMFRQRPLSPVAARVAVVTIDDIDIAQVGSWPVPDGVLAEALEKVTAHQPRAVGIDIYRDLPIGNGNADLNRILRSQENIYGVEAPGVQRVQPSPALAGTDRVGFPTFPDDRDRTVRRAIFSLRDETIPCADSAQSRCNEQIRFSLALLLAERYLAEEEVFSEPVSDRPSHIRLGKQVYQPLTGREYLYRGDEVGGFQVLSNWWGNAGRFPQIALRDLLADRFDPELLRDRIVLIGTTAESTKDLFAMPLAPLQSHAGVFLHADVANQLVEGALEGRPAMLRVLEGRFEWIWIGLWASVAAAVVWLLEDRQTSRWQLRMPTGVLILSLALIAGNYGVFRYGFFVLPTVSPAVAIAIGAIATANANKQIRLRAVNAELSATNAKLQVANTQLQDYSKTLEARVQRRTEDLARALKAADAASEAKSQFLSHMSHELRTPLNAILGFAQLLERQPEGSRTSRQEKIGIIRRSGEHLLKIVNDILSLAKIEAGQLELHEGDCDLPQLLFDLEEMLALKATNKSLTLSFHCDPRTPHHVRLDAGKLRQILINLLGNAIKFTHQGCVTLRTTFTNNVTADSTTDRPDRNSNGTGNAGGRLAFAISDTGPGIAAEDLERIFAPFAQAENGRAQSEGTGLGLSISRRFVRLLGGELVVRSQLGQGTTFSFEIPIAFAAAPAPIASVAEPVAAPGPLAPSRPESAKHRVLIVDDDPIGREVMEALMARVGVATRAAANGREAIAQWETWQPDLIWMDLSMPDLDGFAATRKIRAEGGKGAIVALTALAFNEDRERALAAGCDELVSKPYQEATILQALDRHLGTAASPLPAATHLPDLSATPAAAQPAAVLDERAELQQLPDSLLIALRQAVDALDVEKMLDLIAVIARDRTLLATHLTRLVEDFQYERLGQLLQERASVNPKHD